MHAIYSRAGGAEEPRCHFPRNGQARQASGTRVHPIADRPTKGQPSWAWRRRCPGPHLRRGNVGAAFRALAVACPSPHRPRGVVHPPAAGPLGCGLLRHASSPYVPRLSSRGESGACFRRLAVACERMDPARLMSSVVVAKRRGHSSCFHPLVQVEVTDPVPV